MLCVPKEFITFCLIIKFFNFKLNNVCLIKIKGDHEKCQHFSKQ